MLLARAIAVDRPEDLALAFARMGLPRGAREYLQEKVVHLQVLLTGMADDDRRLLRALAERDASYPEEFPSFVAGDRQRAGTGLLSGRRDQLERLTRTVRERGRAPLADAIDRLWLGLSPPPPLELAGRTLDFAARPRLMGVVNVTPDSFSDGGRFARPEDAIAQGLALAAAGADVIDVGGESTRPGSDPVSAEDELARVLPVIRALKAQAAVPISIDTTKPEVAEAALAAGASLVNDVSGLSEGVRLAEVAAAHGAALCLMHHQGPPKTMQKDPRYDDVGAEVLEFLAGSLARAQAAGVPAARVLVDPGIGFGKTVGHNLFLLRRLGDLRQLGCAIAVGTSRKSFLGKLTGDRKADERLPATLGSIAATAVLGGADLVRVHDVGEARDALTVAQAIREAGEGGSLFERLAPAVPPHTVR